MAKLMTAREVAVQLGCGVDHVFRLTDAKLLRYIDLGLDTKKQRRYTQEEVDRFIESNMTKKIVKQKEDE